MLFSFKRVKLQWHSNAIIHLNLTRKDILVMKGLMKSTKILSMACAVAVGAYATTANAQTANMTATATVLNTLTLATPAQLNFGTIVAVSDTVQTATATVDTAGAISVATTGAPAVTAVVDNTAVAVGQVTVANGADGATLNININNVVDPVNGPESFVLDSFNTSWNGGGAALQVINTPFTETFSAAFGGGINTLDIGATITTTTAAAAPYTDGVYAGTYDVVFSY